VEVSARREPALPPVGAAQLLDGLLDERAVGGAALLALGLVSWVRFGILPLSGPDELEQVGVEALRVREE
jgi:hypothetical protein